MKFLAFATCTWFLVGCVLPDASASTWPASEADSFSETARMPDVQVTEYASIREACEGHFAAYEVSKSVDDRFNDRIHAEAERVPFEITEQEFQKTTAPWQNEVRRANRRVLASYVGVLRAAGYTDWKMYSRYSVDGVGDLWDSQVIAGDRVASDKNHPDYRYTGSSVWPIEVINICKRYE